MSMPPVESLPWASWAEEGLRDLATMNPRCITLSAILPEGEIYTGYWNCDLSDKIMTAGHIQMDANMDMLSEEHSSFLRDRSLRIFSRTPALPPQYIGENGVVRNSITTEGDSIDGTVENSVLFSGVTVEEGATVRNSVVMQGCVIRRGAVVDHAILDSDVTVGENARIGDTAAADPEIAVVGTGVTIREGDTVMPGAMLNASDYEKNQGGCAV